MSSHAAWVIHGCLGIAVSAGTCVVHVCWTAARSFFQEASTALAGRSGEGLSVHEAASL